MAFTKEDMARRAAAEIPEGSIVNLGIGLPTLCADYLPEGHAFLHSENGLLGMGPSPSCRAARRSAPPSRSR
jgi:acyl CoA:acetate/3-ketoacid CoA transferase beta subunit